MVIFNSYLKLPEGSWSIYNNHSLRLFLSASAKEGEILFVCPQPGGSRLVGACLRNILGNHRKPSSF